MQEQMPRSPVTRNTHTVWIFYIYAALWFALAVYISGFSSDHDPYATTLATGVLVIAALLHFLATSARTLSGAAFLLLAMAVLMLPTALLFLHQTASPYLYLLYLTANATVAAFVVDIYAQHTSAMPRWLSGLQVAYLVILGLDSLARVFNATYPVDDLRFLDALHSIADVRLVLFIPIIIAWLVIAILRCRRDGSIDEIPVVWRTDVGIISAIAQLPLRFAASVATFLAIVLRRIGQDFLYEFRFHARHLSKYLCTVVTAGMMFIGARAFSPLLVTYIRSPTPIEGLLQPAHAAKLIATPLVGFILFLLVPFINAGLAKFWMSNFSFQRLRQRAYDTAVTAAAPCVVIGPLLWAGARLFTMEGFEDLGLVSLVSFAFVGIAIMFGPRWKSLSTVAATDRVETTPLDDDKRSAHWRTGFPVLLVGGLVAAAFGALHVHHLLTAKQDMRLPIGQTLHEQVPWLGGWRYFWIDLPPGVDSLSILMTSPEDVNLYSMLAKKPTPNSQPCPRKARNDGNVASSACTHPQPAAGQWWLGAYGSSRSNFSITASATYKIEGNAGPSGVKVSATRDDLTFKVESDASGNYTLSGLPAANYTLKATKPGCTFMPDTIPVEVGPNSPGKNFQCFCSIRETGYAYSNIWKEHSVKVPDRTQKMEIRLSGNGYVALDAAYQQSTPDKSCTKYERSIHQSCTLNYPRAGKWRVRVYGFQDTGYSLNVDTHW